MLVDVRELLTIFHACELQAWARRDMGLLEAVRNAEGRPMRAHERRRFPFRWRPTPQPLGRGAPGPEVRLMKPKIRVDVRLNVNVAACLWAIAAIIHIFF